LQFLNRAIGFNSLFLSPFARAFSEKCKTAFRQRRDGDKELEYFVELSEAKTVLESGFML